MPALDASPASRAVVDLDVETPHEGTHRRERFLILARHAGHHHRAATVWTRGWHAGALWVSSICAGRRRHACRPYSAPARRSGRRPRPCGGSLTKGPPVGILPAAQNLRGHGLDTSQRSPPSSRATRCVRNDLLLEPCRFSGGSFPGGWRSMGSEPSLTRDTGAVGGVGARREWQSAATRSMIHLVSVLNALVPLLQRSGLTNPCIHRSTHRTEAGRHRALCREPVASNPGENAPTGSRRTRVRKATPATEAGGSPSRGPGRRPASARPSVPAPARTPRRRGWSCRGCR